MIERDETGRRWFIAYQQHHHPTQPPVELDCPDHPDERLVRILGGAWICTECARARPAPS